MLCSTTFPVEPSHTLVGVRLDGVIASVVVVAFIHAVCPLESILDTAVGSWEIQSSSGDEIFNALTYQREENILVRNVTGVN